MPLVGMDILLCSLIFYVRWAAGLDSKDIPKPKFQVGDLVRVIENVPLGDDDSLMAYKGDVGLIIEVEYVDSGFMVYSCWDYHVLIGKDTLYFFEEELELIK